MSSYTIEEILRQPDSWQKISTLAEKNVESLTGFIKGFITEDSGEIVLTGAGSSEYVGKTLSPYLNEHTKYAVRPCGTTDIVTSPKKCISAGKNTVMVSFARSGDSPESLGAISVAEAVSSRLKQVIITCNREGKLSKLATGKDQYYVINLPEETNDKGFAMTNSFSSMYLLVLLCLTPEKLEENRAAVQEIAEVGKRFLEHDAKLFTDWTGSLPFNRIVYLGTNSLKGLAQESALKMLELTRGNVATLFDTPIGFRHGPKSFVNDETLTVLYLSDEPFARKYELDLLAEMSKERKKNKLLVVSGQACKEAAELADYYYCFNNKKTYDNGILAPEFVLVAQMIALNKSLSLQIDPDNPNPKGIVNRVVRGVTIYPYLK